MTIEGLTEAVGKLPLLEELEVFEATMWGDYLKVVGQSCPKLKILKLNCFRSGLWPPLHVSDDDALAIAETMHGLLDLHLFGNSLTDAGLKAILDNCPDLEHLDLGRCFNVHFSGDLEKRCSERIKVLIRPNDGVIDIDLSIFEDKDPDMLDIDYYQDQSVDTA
ncbi:F-box protein SKIP19 [Raphanus sativus]|nr:F-box protein SKIP19 [Raphanus sativus]